MSHTVLSAELLERLAGASVYAQALSEQQGCSVQQFSLSARCAEGVVAGYQVKLNYHHDSAEGACECPASDGFEFCKHCVLLALHSNRATQQLMSLSKGPDKSKIMAYLLALDKAELAKQMLALLETDTDAFKRYLLKASLDQDQLDIKALRSELTELTRAPKDLFSQRQMRHFLARIERFLEELSRARCQGQEDSLLKLIEYAIQRINQVLSKLEDRGGQHHSLKPLLQGLYIGYFKTLAGRPETLAKRFAKTWDIDHFELLGPAERILAAHPEILSKFIALKQSQWQALAKDDATSRMRDRLAELLAANISEQSATELHCSIQRQLAHDESQQRHLLAQWRERGWEDAAEQLQQDLLKRYPSSLAVYQQAFEHYAQSPAHEALLFGLFCHFPMQLGPDLIAYSQNHSLDNSLENSLDNAQARQDDLARLRERMAAELLQQDEAQAQFYGLCLLLDNKATEVMLQKLTQCTLTAEQIGELAIRLSSHSREHSANLLAESLNTLNAKGMGWADKKAAELLWRYQQNVDANGTQLGLKLPRALDQSPSFTEHYRSLSGQTFKKRLFTAPLDDIR